MTIIYPSRASTDRHRPFPFAEYAEKADRLAEADPEFAAALAEIRALFPAAGDRARYVTGQADVGYYAEGWAAWFSLFDSNGDNILSAHHHGKTLAEAAQITLRYVRAFKAERGLDDAAESLPIPALRLLLAEHEASGNLFAAAQISSKIARHDGTIR